VFECYGAKYCPYLFRSPWPSVVIHGEYAAKRTDVPARAQHRLGRVAEHELTALHMQTDDQDPEQVAELVMCAFSATDPAEA
jgi:hypothetical protein